ncbi:glycogen synthase (ADP-glucose) [Thermoanaerobacter thermohydrosulfuricus]|uniref:Glycogen synthase, Corynebacterium family n=2 Tax=Thermoanaerobacter thermohydrosulfuricus TaxID=1516 RepID=M8DGM0_THETY|nr:MULTISPECIES: glycogen synthase [Thermoanaerobacter]EMT39197.1 glycogen synthase, Corynebacterium family [Thermoanaerobacter thermohydrosulfuricus WC1]SDG60238.1 glycogen synthase (ADP-glucose) [Thermoanaerobacter thermohydrosulfuricus]SFE13923.1 glycogen synthase (ADP-glucose) [Thermoanaerobacter thermohydrosulfuricus]
MDKLKVTMFTNEYPPNIYGGAGVHVDYLVRELSKLMEVDVRCFGDQDYTADNLKVRGYKEWDKLKENSDPRYQKVLGPFSIDLAMVKDEIDSDILHCHTWYTFMAGFLAKKLYDKPLVVTVHSLEPLRPWKEEQLGNGYKLSSWMERTGIEAADRVIAVSQGSKEDILKYYNIPEEKVEVIYNGIDLNQYQKTDRNIARQKYGIEGKYILFVGRISRQKGITHLIDAVKYLPKDIKVVLCASSPDTQEVLEEVEQKVKLYDNIIWINKMVEKEEIIELYSNAEVFACPSVYEPFGIINLEAMACKTPVVASATGGIKEVVVHEETGFLVEPGNPEELAKYINILLNNKDLAIKFGENGRKRVEEMFSWESIAKKTYEMYKDVIEKYKK